MIYDILLFDIAYVFYLLFWVVVFVGLSLGCSVQLLFYVWVV